MVKMGCIEALPKKKRKKKVATCGGEVETKFFEEWQLGVELWRPFRKSTDQTAPPLQPEISLKSVLSRQSSWIKTMILSQLCPRLVYFVCPDFTSVSGS